MRLLLVLFAAFVGVLAAGFAVLSPGVAMAADAKPDMVMVLGGPAQADQIIKSLAGNGIPPDHTWTASSSVDYSNLKQAGEKVKDAFKK